MFFCWIADIIRPGWLREFRPTARSARPAGRLRARKAMELYDTNHDGFLDDKELEQCRG